MNTQHTLEPWVIFDSKVDDGHIYIQTQINGDKVFPAYGIALIPGFQNNDEANANRIVQCVNGCKGIVDPENTVPDLIAALSSLVLFMYESEDDYENTAHYRDAMRRINNAKAALAKAKGETP